VKAPASCRLTISRQVSTPKQSHAKVIPLPVRGRYSFQACHVRISGFVFLVIHTTTRISSKTKQETKLVYTTYSLPVRAKQERKKKVNMLFVMEKKDGPMQIRKC
jgi:hypothetical protein